MALYEKFKNNPDFVMISVVFGFEKGRFSTPDMYDEFNKEHGITWRQVYVSDNKEQNRYGPIFGLKGIPYSMIIDRDGAILDVDTRGDERAAKIEQALNNPKTPEESK